MHESTWGIRRTEKKNRCYKTRGERREVYGRPEDLACALPLSRYLYGWGVRSNHDELCAPKHAAELQQAKNSQSHSSNGCNSKSCLRQICARQWILFRQRDKQCRRSTGRLFSHSFAFHAYRLFGATGLGIHLIFMLRMCERAQGSGVATQDDSLDTGNATSRSRAVHCASIAKQTKSKLWENAERRASAAEAVCLGSEKPNRSTADREFSSFTSVRVRPAQGQSVPLEDSFPGFLHSSSRAEKRGG